MKLIDQQKRWIIIKYWHKEIRVSKWDQVSSELDPMGSCDLAKGNEGLGYAFITSKLLPSTGPLSGSLLPHPSVSHHSVSTYHGQTPFQHNLMDKTHSGRLNTPIYRRGKLRGQAKKLCVLLLQSLP